MTVECFHDHLGGPCLGCSKLNDQGIIKKYSIVLDNEKIGKKISAFILITVNYDLLKQNDKTQTDLAKKLGSHPAVEESTTVTGETDILIKVRVKGMDELNKLIEGFIKFLSPKPGI